MMLKDDFNGVIYRVENQITGEAYVGITTNSIKQRQLDHTERAVRGESGKFYEAIATFGEDAFTWEQIDTAESTDELAAKEKEYIIVYNSKEEGYNSDSGGGIEKTVYQYNCETKELINKFQNLKSAASAISATKQDISRACLGSNGILKGYFWSYNNSEIFIPNGDSRKKRVVQLDMNKKFIAEFSSVAEASKNTGLSKTCIARVCREERSASGGFIWKYEV